MKARLAELGGAPLPGSSADFGQFIAAETEKWGKVIRAANINVRRSDPAVRRTFHKSRSAIPARLMSGLGQ